MDVRGRAGRVSGRTNRPPTIHDVARHAGVSPTTVSRVINGEHTVRGAKRDAVLAAVTALSFSPNKAARRLAGSAPVRIGLLYGNPSASYLGEFLIGCLDEASRLGVQLTVERCDPDADPVAAARRLIDTRVDGLLLTPPLSDLPEVIDTIAEAGRHLVIVGSGRPAGANPAIGIDDTAAAAEMTGHLIASGHRRIGFVTGAMTVLVSGDRLRGYHRAMADAGVAVDAEWVVEGDYTYRSGLQAARHLLDLNPRPTAIFASNDDMAAAAIAEAQRLGIAIPAELSVCGFDDTTLATAIWPELTTIRQPIADMARQGMAMLIDDIGHVSAAPAGEPPRRVLAYELIRRASDGPPRRPAER